MNRRIRVLQVLSSLNTGGTELYAINTYRYLNKNKVQFDFLVFTEGDNDYYEKEVKLLGANVYHLYVKNNRFEQMKSIYKFLLEKKYSIIHINACSLKDILLTSLPAKKAKIKHIIAHAHSPGTPKNTKIDGFIRYILKKLILFSATDYFACSLNVAEAKYTNKIANTKVEIIKNAIDLDKFKYDKEKRKIVRNKYEIKETDYVIGMVGRFEKEKNHKFIINVFEKIKDRKNIKLLLIGNGSLLNEMINLTKKLGIDESVIFTNKIDNVSDYYSAMDLLVLPSLYEGFPFVAVEAQASGLPVYISENVTDDCLLVEGCRKISISNGINDWIQAILSYKINRNREEAVKILRNKGYDLNDEVQRLTELYCSMESEI